MSKKTLNEFRLLPVAAAILLAYGNVYAEDSSDVHDLITPGSSVSVGIGIVNSGNDAKRFSEYSGLNQNGSLLLDFEINKRNDATGFWTIINGRNLGLETRELNFSQSKQGDWKYALDYNEIVRRDPYIIHTGMTGIGSTTPAINLIARPVMPAAWATANGFTASNGVAGSDVELKLKRTAIGLSGEKWFTPEMQFELSFRDEQKKGARMFGRAGLDSSDMSLRPTIGTGGANGGWAILLTPEPIDSSIRQLEAKLNFNREKLAVTGGYYGSFYVNNNGSLTPNVPGTLNRGALWNGGAAGSSTVQQLASSSVALPPDNQAHQLYLTGNYAFSKDTRSNFKLSYTHATQNDSFTGMGLTPATGAPSSLGGVVDTTLLQLGLTMRPLKELSVNGSFRYEDRNDKTPVNVYNTSGTAGTALNNTTNWASGSQTRISAKLDGIYRLPEGYSLTVGGDWERKKTPLPPSNTALFSAQVLFRPVLNEYGLHTELRKALSETVNGAIGVEYKKRRGNNSDWVTTNGVTVAATPTTNTATSNALVSFNPAVNDPATCVQATTGALGWTCTAASANRVLPILYMDRDRTKLRGSLDWDATNKLSLQGVVEHTQDKYLRDFATPMVGVATAAQGKLVALGAMQPSQDIATVPGARVIIGDSISLDSSYKVADEWRLNIFGSRSYNRWNVNKASLGDDTRNTAYTGGLAINGNATSRLTLGMEILTTYDKTTFRNVVVNSTVTGGALIGTGNTAGFTAATPGNYLPNINYRTNKLNLRGKYSIDKASDVLVAFAYQQFKTDDWQWGYNGVPFVYSDNTTVSQPMTQNLRFWGTSYILRF